MIVLSVKPNEVTAAYKPSVPQFTVKLVDYSYDIPPSSTTTVNPYNGKETTTTTPGRHVEVMDIEVTAKNQPFTPYTDNGVNYELYYRLEVKGRFGDEWTRYAPVLQSDSQYTTVWRCRAGDYVAGDQIDFRLEAIVGYRDYYAGTMPLWTAVAVESSGWSKVQTFTVPGGSSIVMPSQIVIPSENPSITPDNNQPQQPDLSQILDFVSHPLFLLGVGVLFVSVIVTVVMVFSRHHLKTLNFGDNFSS